MKKNLKVLILIIAASMLLTMFSCSKLKDGESYALSENGLYSFIYVNDDYEFVAFSGGDSTFVVNNISIEVKSVVEENPSDEGLDDFCATLPNYERYSTFFADFDFSKYETVKLNKMKNVRYYEKHIEAEDSELVMKPATVQIYIFAGENAYYIITAGYMDHAKDDAVKVIRNLIDTFEERKPE